jgi:hypothetical protein
LGKVPELIRGEKWIQTLNLDPNMLGLSLGVVARAHGDDGCTPSKARHVMPSILGYVQMVGSRFHARARAYA